MKKKVCFIHLKNWYSSFYHLIFEEAYNQLRIGNYELWIKVVLKTKSLFKKQWKNYRSAVAVAQSKCMFFLFAYCDVSDCFCGKGDAWLGFWVLGFGFMVIVLDIRMASAFPLMQLLLFLWQIKKRYSCWLLLVLWVPECNYEWSILNYEKGCFGNVALTKPMSFGRLRINSTYRFKHKVAKNSYCERSWKQL